MKRTNLDSRIARCAQRAGATLKEGFEVGKGSTKFVKETALWHVTSSEVQASASKGSVKQGGNSYTPFDLRLIAENDNLPIRLKTIFKNSRGYKMSSPLLVSCSPKQLTHV